MKAFFDAEKSLSFDYLCSKGRLWYSRTRFACDPNNEDFTHRDWEWFQDHVACHFPGDESVEFSRTGRLGQSIEGGGKRRIFAIGNYVNQRLLKPVHDWLI